MCEHSQADAVRKPRLTDWINTGSVRKPNLPQPINGGTMFTNVNVRGAMNCATTNADNPKKMYSFRF